MTCTACAKRIEKRLNKLAGVQHCAASYENANAQVEFDDQQCDQQTIFAAVREIGYEPQPANGAYKAIGFVLLILALFVASEQVGVLNLLGNFELAKETMPLAAIFVIGLLTSVHCVAMCGGINLSQTLGKTAKKALITSNLLYHSGRILGYTLVGALVGTLGRALGFSLDAKGVLELIAGGFMLIIALNMLGIVPFLRRIRLTLPDSWRKTTAKTPFVIGLFNALMPCAPLQAMQLYALSTASITLGAVSMLVFALGTTPLLFAFGAVGLLCSKKALAVVQKAGAVVVAVLGLLMLSNGWALLGLSDISSLQAQLNTQQKTAEKQIEIENGVQIIRSSLQAGRYPPITVKEGIPVKWIIEARAGTINGCNNRLIAREYGISKPLAVGENIIEFTPNKAGTFAYSCWMGMIRSTITVVKG